MTQDEKQWIDNASYEELLGRWRRLPSGSSWFIGETGEYYSKVMARKRSKAERRIRWQSANGECGGHGISQHNRWGCACYSAI